MKSILLSIMKSILLSLLALTGLIAPAHARYLTSPRGGFLSVGADLGTKGLGLEISLVNIEGRSAAWYGVVLGGVNGYDSEDTHGFLGVEAGVAMVGIEAGVAVPRSGGTRARIRGVLTSGVVTPYVEYQATPSPWAAGVLLKLPLKL